MLWHSQPSLCSPMMFYQDIPSMSTKWFVDLYRPNVCTLLWTTTYTACRQWGVNIKSFCQYNGKFLQIPVWFKVGEAVISNFKKTSTSTNKLLMRRQLLIVTATHSTKRLEKISAVLRQYQNQTASDRQMDRWPLGHGTDCTMHVQQNSMHKK